MRSSYSMIGGHVIHHRSFYTAALLGAVAGALTHIAAPRFALFVAGDTFYFSYLIFMTSIIAQATPSDFRDWAERDDEGIALISLITAAAICFSMVSLFELVNEPGRPETLRLVLSIASAPLAWAVLHTIAAFHYAHLYYADNDPGPARADAGGLKFPETEEPGPSDFVYYSFVVGMTAQVSDVQVTTASMRRVTVLHGIVSFFLNTVLIALAVNVVVALAQSGH